MPFSILLFRSHFFFLCVSVLSNEIFARQMHMTFGSYSKFNHSIRYSLILNSKRTESNPNQTYKWKYSQIYAKTKKIHNMKLVHWNKSMFWMLKREKGRETMQYKHTFYIVLVCVWKREGITHSTSSRNVFSVQYFDMNIVLYSIQE